MRNPDKLVLPNKPDLIRRWGWRLAICLSLMVLLALMLGLIRKHEGDIHTRQFEARASIERERFAFFKLFVSDDGSGMVTPSGVVDDTTGAALIMTDSVRTDGDGPVLYKRLKEWREQYPNKKIRAVVPLREFYRRDPPFHGLVVLYDYEDETSASGY